MAHTSAKSQKVNHRLINERGVDGPGWMSHFIAIMPPKVQNASHTGVKIREPQSLFAKIYSSVPLTVGNRWSRVLGMTVVWDANRGILQQTSTRSRSLSAAHSPVRQSGMN